MTSTTIQDQLAERTHKILAELQGDPDVAERAAHELMGSPHVGSIEATPARYGRWTRILVRDHDGDPILHITVFHAQRAAAIVVPEHAMELHTLEVGR